MIDRLDGLTEQFDELRSRDPAAGSGTRKALEQLSAYPEYMKDLASRDLARQGRPAPLAGKMRQYSENVVRASSKLLEWFASPHSIDLPAALFQEVEDALTALEIGDRQAILTTGLPNRIETYVSDVRSVLYHPHKPPADPESPTLALITVPRQEGASPRWWPIILGHELAHLRITSLLATREGNPDHASGEDIALPIELRTEGNSYGMLRHLNALENFPFDAMRQAITGEASSRRPRSVQPTPGIAPTEPANDGHRTPSDASNGSPHDTKIDASTLAGRVKIADAWAIELVCDLAMARRYGPSAVAALGTYLTAVGDYSALSTTHPPGYLRLQLLLGHLGTDPSNVLTPVLKPWIDDARAIEAAQPQWAVIIREHLVTHYAAIEAELQTWPTEHYDWHDPARQQAVILAHRQLSFGLPPHAGKIGDYLPGFAETDDEKSGALNTGAIAEPTDADVICAAWLTVMALGARTSNNSVHNAGPPTTSTPTPSASTTSTPNVDSDEHLNVPVDRLILKSLEDRQLLRAYREGDSSVEGDSNDDAALGSTAQTSPRQTDAPESSAVRRPETVSSGTSGALLGREEIKARMRHTNPWQRLEVIPNLPNNIQTASIDVRLGTRYITFHRASTTSFNAVEGSKARDVQHMVERGWGLPFVLHPGELVLASVLEYVALPVGMAAQVVTRSSYGRLGLITATAVQVHPMYHGCLTLELANLGTVPLELYPGERIAQLVLFDVSIAAGTPEPALTDIFGATYSCPTGPQFPKVSVDEWITRVQRETRRRS